MILVVYFPLLSPCPPRLSPLGRLFLITLHDDDDDDDDEGTAAVLRFNASMHC